MTERDDIPVAGSIETQVRADIEALVTSHPMGESLAAMAFSLARQLDVGIKELAVAGVNKELRETLCELAKLADVGDDGLSDALSVPTTLGDGS